MEKNTNIINPTNATNGIHLPIIIKKCQLFRSIADILPIQPMYICDKKIIKRNYYNMMLKLICKKIWPIIDAYNLNGILNFEQYIVLYGSNLFIIKIMGPNNIFYNAP